MKMKLEQVKEALANAGKPIESESRLPNDTGHRLRLPDGIVVNVFDTGTVNVQPKGSTAIEAILSAASGQAPSKPPKPTLKKQVFVVYGHDNVARTQLEAMLRRWGLEPLILDQLPSRGQTIIEKLEQYTGRVDFAVVLATPDDEGHLAGHSDEKKYRARQNVVLELGMLLAELGRPKVAILLKDQGKMERPSDIQGLIYIPFSDDLEKETKVLLAKEMKNQGFDIQVENL